MALLTSFEVTPEPLENPALEKLPTKVRERLEVLHHLVHADPAGAVKELEIYVARFPEVACCQNWLAKCYCDVGRQGEARALAERTVEQHPDYFFGKMILAQFLLREENLDGVDALLGTPKTPTSIAPHRQVFHYSEVLSYFHNCGHFHLLTGEFDAARHCLDIMKDLAPRNFATKDLARLCEAVLSGHRSSARELSPERDEKTLVRTTHG